MIPNELICNTEGTVSPSSLAPATFSDLPVANLGVVRRVVDNGREYLVAPTTLLVSGVLNGSAGALYYPAEEVGNPLAVDAWNGVPVVVNHPTDEKGQAISARSQKVLSRYKIGRVYNVQAVKNLDDGTERLGWNGEAWFDVASTKRVAPDIYGRLIAGNAIEVSTGLYTWNQPAPDGSLYNGRPYRFVARNYRPDHLAVLPDSRGACSNSDGCGINVNKNAKDTHMDRDGIINWLTANCDCWKGQGDREVLNRFDDAKLVSLKASAEKVKEQEVTINSLKGDLAKAATTAVTPVVTTAVTPAVTTPVVNTPATPAAPATLDSWLASAPAEVQSVVKNALSVELREKQAIVERLTANITDAALKKSHGDFFLGKPLTELQMLAALVPQANAYTQPQLPWMPGGYQAAPVGNPLYPTQPAVNYGGAAGGPGPQVNNQQQDAFGNAALVVPSLSFNENDPEVAFKKNRKVG